MSKDLAQYHEMGEKIEKFIRPATFPLAIKLIKDESEIPPGVKRPSVDLKVQNFICQNFKMARAYGWTIAVTEKDCNCKLARAVYGWDPITEESLKFMNQFSVGLYSKDIETSNKIANHMYRLDNQFRGLVISPLSRTKVEPDVVLSYCLPAQAMRFVQSYLFMEGGVLEFTAAGRLESCHLGVIKSYITKKAQISLLGNGDRVWGGAQDSELVFVCPQGKLKSLIEGLEATHAAGLRYPIPAYMNYAPGFQNAFKKRATKRAGGTIIKDQ